MIAGKIAYLVGGEEYDEHDEVIGYTLLFKTEEPPYYVKFKKIVYFEVE